MKHYNRLQMNFKGKPCHACALSLGVAVFAMAMYFFGFRTLAGMGFLKVLFQLILPFGLCAAMVVLISVLRWNAPGLYGILGTALCLVLMVGTFFSGNLILAIISLVLYCGAGVTLLGHSGGFLPFGVPVGLIYPVIAVLRLLFTLRKVSLKGWVLEIAVYAMLAGLMFLTASMKAVPAETEE